MNFLKKYSNEFMRASKFAGFFALGMLIATGIVPAIFSETRAEAIDQLVGSVYGILTSYCGVVLLLWGSEILRTRRLAKLKAEKKAINDLLYRRPDLAYDVHKYDRPTVEIIDIPQPDRTYHQKW